MLFCYYYWRRFSSCIHVYTFSVFILIVIDATDYDCILAMALGSSWNGRLEVTQFSVPATSGAVSVIWRDALRNTSRLAAPGSLNTHPMCKESK